MAAQESSALSAQFLKAVYLAELEHPRVTLNVLGKALGVTAPAVSRRAARYIRRGYLVRDGACGLALTPKGERVALRAVRKHEVFEAFLVSVMGYPWYEVFTAAWRSATYLPDEVIERMFARAGHPRYCPHGHPIPSAEGRIEAVLDRPLLSLSEGTTGALSRIFTHDPGILRYLDALGLLPGRAICLRYRAPFNGPLHLHVFDAPGRGEREVVISPEVASFIHVQPT
jgi:DtxR family Mn-dependent transcriptional regulator